MNKSALRKCILVISLALLSLKPYAQINADSAYHSRLYFLCKTWGHVKYFHTEVAKGEVDWDDALLAAIQGVKNAASNDAFNQAVADMINKAGEMGTSDVPRPDVPDSLNNNLDTEWVNDPALSATVSEALNTIMNRFKPQNNAYVDEAWPGGPPNFDGDNLYYSGIVLPGEPERILALFRYWNIINYFFPYKDIMDQHWDTTLVEFIPQIVGADGATAYHLAFKELTTRLNDSHASFSSNIYWDWRGRHFPPFQVRFIENETVITKVLKGNGQVAAGDIIKEIDGRDIYELRNELRQYAHGSNDVIIERTLNEFILWGDNGSFEVKVDNGSGTRTEILERNESNFGLLNDSNLPIWKKVIAENGCEVGVVDMGRLETEDVDQMFDDLYDTEAIVFDVRSYPNGTLWVIVNYLFSTPINIANFTTPDITYPGRLSWHNEVIGSGTTEPYPGKLVILFDERTQSQAEYTCMGLEQFPRATKIGSTTSAADGNVAGIYVPGNIFTRATFLGVFYPDYTPTQRVGIVPDIEVRPTIAGIRNGMDEVMDAAFNFLNCPVITAVEPENVEKVSFYPNPVNHSLIFEIPGNYQGNDLRFEISDLMGKKLKSISKNVSTGEIDFSNLKNGTYIIRVITDKKTITKKIVKN